MPSSSTTGCCESSEEGSFLRWQQRLHLLPQRTVGTTSTMNAIDAPFSFRLVRLFLRAWKKGGAGGGGGGLGVASPSTPIVFFRSGSGVLCSQCLVPLLGGREVPSAHAIVRRPVETLSCAPSLCTTALGIAPRNLGQM